MRGIAGVLCTLLIFWQGCDVRTTSQEQVRQKLEAALRPYFPRVKVGLDRDRQRLAAYTCATNVGEAAVKLVPAILDKDFDFRRLKQFHSALRLSTFEMLFDRYVLTLDFERDTYDTKAIELVSGASEREAKACTT